MKTREAATNVVGIVLGLVGGLAAGVLLAYLIPGPHGAFGMFWVLLSATVGVLAGRGVARRMNRSASQTPPTPSDQ